MKQASHSHSSQSQATVIVGMSGGVDSSVAALLLREQGYRVAGMFMKNWEEKDENGVCTSAQDYQDAQRVCEKLDIPLYAVEFVREYREQVFSEFLKAYEQGLTPNPDILCNREIKFNVFLKHAMALGADFLATGHYARKLGNLLAKGVDPGKDQSYFIYTLKQQVLERVLFPVGGLLKSEVRELARRHELPTAEKKDSTGICFIGERDFRRFLGQYLPAQPGEIHTLDGRCVGTHEGSAFYTLGQRKGLGLGGEGARWYVVDKDAQRNIVYVERGESHPALFCEELWADEVSWVAEAPPEELVREGSLCCLAKVRYRQADQACRVSGWDGDSAKGLRIDFDEPQRAITPGQSVVLYQGEICLGGAIIRRRGPSLHERASSALAATAGR